MPTHDPWPWPDELDALRAAAAYHTRLFENDAVRVLVTTIPPAQATPVHTHRWPSVIYYESWSDCVARDGDERVIMDSRQMTSAPRAGVAIWLPSLAPHSLENVGNVDLRAITVEVKNA